MQRQRCASGSVLVFPARGGGLPHLVLGGEWRRPLLLLLCPLRIPRRSNTWWRPLKQDSRPRSSAGRPSTAQIQRITVVPAVSAFARVSSPSWPRWHPHHPSTPFEERDMVPQRRLQAFRSRRDPTTSIRGPRAASPPIILIPLLLVCSLEVRRPAESSRRIHIMSPKASRVQTLKVTLVKAGRTFHETPLVGSRRDQVLHLPAVGEIEGVFR